MAENNFQQLYVKIPSSLGLEIIENYVMPRSGKANYYLLRDLYFILEIKDKVSEKFILCFHLSSELDQ